MTNSVQHRGWISRIRPGTASAALALLVVPGLGLVTAQSAQAQTFTVLHTFTNTPDGRTPLGDLVLDENGNLYGTTWGGGTSGYGTVFKVDTNGNETALYSFGDGEDGGFPQAGVIRDAEGNLYGTTQQGGVGVSLGVVFKVDKTGKETVLHSFNNPEDGAWPYAALVQDAAGTLYGTTTGGGTSNLGTVFKLDKHGNERVLYSFAGQPDGAYPCAGLVVDAAGNLYGTTLNGGGTGCNAYFPGCGTVFKVDKHGKETVLHRFTVGSGDGGLPYASLIRDKAGNLYGTTWIGGSYGGGAVYKIDTAGKETMLPTPLRSHEPHARLVQDAAGNLYGTTEGEGGTVFMITTGKVTKAILLHQFALEDGFSPLAGLLRDIEGNLYGTTSDGGESASCIRCVGNGSGTVFKLTPH